MSDQINEDRETIQRRLLQTLGLDSEQNATKTILDAEDPQIMIRLHEALTKSRVSEALLSVYLDHPLLAKALDAHLAAHPEDQYSEDSCPDAGEIAQKVSDLMVAFGVDSTGFPRADRTTLVHPYAKVKFLNFLVQENICTQPEAAAALSDGVLFDQLEDRLLFGVDECER